MEENEIRLKCLEIAIQEGMRRSEFSMDNLLDNSAKFYEHVKDPSLLDKLKKKVKK